MFVGICMLPVENKISKSTLAAVIEENKILVCLIAALVAGYLTVQFGGRSS